MTELKPSNFTLLEQTFQKIIKSKKDRDGSGRPDDIKTRRKTYELIDDSILYVTEIIDLKKNVIDIYYYDWCDKDKKVLLKFHSHPHDDNERLQTDTEPFHIQPSDRLADIGYERFCNYRFRELFHVFELIEIFIAVRAAEELNKEPTQQKKTKKPNDK